MKTGLMIVSLMLAVGTSFAGENLGMPKFDIRPMGGGVTVELANATSQLVPVTGVEVLTPIGHGFSAVGFFTTAGGSRVQFLDFEGQSLAPEQAHHMFGFGVEFGTKITAGLYILMGDKEPPNGSWAFGVFAPKVQTPIWGLNARFGLRLAKSGYDSYSLKYLPTVSFGW